jgi:tRNA-dihydrouridine synthase 4
MATEAITNDTVEAKMPLSAADAARRRHFVDYVDDGTMNPITWLFERRALFADDVSSCVKIVAPMVRYSKLPFRLLCRQYSADITHTPMVLAKEFNCSQDARNASFQTADADWPLVVQFASNDPVEMGQVALKCIYDVEGIDLNCGCPQKWAISDGIGAALIKQPELVKQMVKEVRANVPATMPVSVKIRLRNDMRDTIDLVKRAAAVGVSYVSVHGRRTSERRSPVRIDELRTVKELSPVPIVANGDLFAPGDIVKMVNATGVDGVMCARGLLANPALFARRLPPRAADYTPSRSFAPLVGAPAAIVTAADASAANEAVVADSSTDGSAVDGNGDVSFNQVPLQVVSDYMYHALQHGGLPKIHLHHFTTMLDKNLSRGDRRELQQARSMAGVLSFLQTRDWWSPAHMHPTPPVTQQQ